MCEGSLFLDIQAEEESVSTSCSGDLRDAHWVNTCYVIFITDISWEQRLPEENLR